MKNEFFFKNQNFFFPESSRPALRDNWFIGFDRGNLFIFVSIFDTNQEEETTNSHWTSRGTKPEVVGKKSIT